ncbi:MAR-binding filament-like protein [Rhynchospora pubera]|uniref:MAR-binding filament-like protein n=1 Tax=Rhynchospora pubera TaxID=906938 RepID=A0AAV8GMC6_9POAL|nr:MAR-binding filament-like protein [Rhynchospora pubera]
MPTVVAGFSPPALDLLLRGRTSFVQVQPPSLPPRSGTWTYLPSLLSNHKASRLSLTVASSSSSFSSSSSGFDGWLDERGKSESSFNKKSVLSNLIQDIEPLDVSAIQKDVPAETVDAMKRTISGMLGLLPSDQFHVGVEAFWDPLFKLLVSSMMTGYTLRNAEYRLSFERNLDFPEDESDGPKNDTGNKVLSTENAKISSLDDDCRKVESDSEKKCEESLDQDIDVEGLGEMSSEARNYIIQMQSRINSMKKELHNLKRKNSALQMQQFVGEEKNDLLDYLRSLKPEKVAELSEPTSPGVEETIQSVAHGLLATLSPKMRATPPDKANDQTFDFGKEDCTEIVENTSLQFQPLISVPRDYLARLLFWCMLLGHYIRGLEYRLELSQLLTISSGVGPSSQNQSL